MYRTAQLSDRRPRWLAASLVTLALAACGGKDGPETVSNDVVQTPVSSTPVVPASTTTPVKDTAPAVPAVVSYDDAEAVFKAGNYAEAKALFAGYAESKPDNPWGWYMLGLASWKSGDLTGADRAFDHALERDPKHVKSLLNSARVLIELGRSTEALERISSARTLDSTSTEALRLLARAHHAKGDTESAVKTYRQALVIDERDVWSMNNLGVLYIEQNDAQSAVAPLARAVQLKPTSPVFQNNLGMALELTGHLAEAKVAYENALKADSSFAKAERNAKRLGEMTIDPTAPAINVSEFAELFRQYVRMWRDSIPTTPDM